MRRIMGICAVGIAVTVVGTYARDFPYADAVTFMGTEQAAAQLKKAVFAVQIEGNTQDQDKANDWISIGTGFFVVGTNAVILGVTCDHVVVMLQTELEKASG